MRLTFLGTGSAMPTGRRAQTGVLCERGDDRLLVDCGSGVLQALARTADGYESLDALLLSHHHVDHVADLVPLLKARWLAGAGALTVAGPPGTETFVEELLAVHDYLADRVTVESMETRHSMQCFAYRVTLGDSAGPAVVLSGDSEAFPDLASFADGAAVLVHDCSFPDDVDVSNHPTPTQLGEALAAADPDVGRVYLTHLYPHTEGRHEEMLEAISTNYQGDVRFASDGLTISINESGPTETD